LFLRFKTGLIALTTHPGCQEAPSAADHEIRLETTKEEIGSKKAGADKLKQEEEDLALAIEILLEENKDSEKDYDANFPKLKTRAGPLPDNNLAPCTLANRYIPNYNYIIISF
jgi:hypothetical protein